jgi:simple sugar transport system ATP-binding protein
VTEAELAEMMVGRQVRFEVEKRTSTPGEPLLVARDLTVRDERDEIVLDRVGFTLHAGEIIGIAGVQGNGQTELVEALTGLRPVAAGSLTFLGADITRASTRERHRRGIAHIPEDRQRSGIVGSFTVAENAVLDSYYEDRFSSGIRLRWNDVHATAARIVRDFDVRTASIFETADHLSGGNQQKLVVARELSREIRLIIASQPTRGVDVGSIEYIHKRIVEARDSGVGVLIVSTELDEIMAISDRILVMCGGRVVSAFEGGKAEPREIGLAMAGIAA